ncbi:SDR family NAD(P)-dependent oxidoreductase [Streptococcus chenjunshii]|uniref:SDR family NAD(P)-dependent oxidoreductase n=1 Tax=Streptococcus chenjunshii TaxID=2173853 RepID=A0A372KLF2_9STRE|nr:SDR family NAD(P)-dependent oxidoreductase [Streptococcus chenjunshii]AXQ79629.1 SDR family NAD(P)-dependent oxidoreductase [Streptococcus chenjunshii]RFU51056.1 SDR family NAD(P)-dependent oxidoreductase [Streptococcus chenjunshii]RFU53100.1 SDR family NAD(P)-dependent oxidoreductase [Streptococcus chenjunshii]
MSATLKQYVCITGASSGIGLEAAKAFAGLGFHLILVARRQKQLEDLRKEVLQQYPDLDILVKSLDLSIPDNAYQLYNSLKSFHVTVWINNAGFGNYDSVAHQNLEKISAMIHLNIEALTLLSSLYVRDYQDIDNSQLINISSRGGYMLVDNAVTYCATKFYVSAFTEGLALEMKNRHHKLQAKVLAPAATKTEFGKVATDSSSYNYDEHFKQYHSAKEMADFLIQLYKSDKTVGLVDVKDFSFHLSQPLFNH